MWDPVRLQHPWFAGIADLAERIAGAREWPSIEMLNECLGAELGSVGVRLVESGKTKAALRDGAIDPASLYEVRIVEHGEIPTRARNAHDLLNTLIWAAFPHSKLALTRALAIIQRERAASHFRSVTWVWNSALSYNTYCVPMRRQCARISGACAYFSVGICPVSSSSGM